jgi:hypothetical protein
MTASVRQCSVRRLLLDDRLAYNSHVMCHTLLPIPAIMSRLPPTRTAWATITTKFVLGCPFLYDVVVVVYFLWSWMYSSSLFCGSGFDSLAHTRSKALLGWPIAAA